MPGQRKNTKLLTASELAQVQGLLALPPIGPQTSARKQLPSWKGTGDKTIRSGLVAELTNALGARLTGDYQEAQRRATLNTVDLDILVAAGNAAKKAVNEVFSEWTAQAALTQTTMAQRKAHVFTASGPGANILDVTDRTARAKGGKPVDGRDVAKHLAANDPGCKTVMAKYQFNPYTGTEDEQECLSEEVLDPFYESNTHALEECDRLGYWMANPDLGLLFAPPYLDSWKQSDGYGAPEVRDRQIQAYLTLIHEYIHTLQHPLIPFALSGSNTVKEGFCEYLTIKVMKHLAGKPGSEFDQIAAEVEGSSAAGRGSALKARVQNYQADKDYAPLVANVNKAISVMGGGDNGLLAAFFQGHTEYIGRYYYGKWLDGALELSDGARTIPTPGAFKSIDELARATGLTAERIVEDNPRIKQASELPAQIYLRGFHGHYMIVDRGNDQEAWENWAMIAAQHDVDAAKIRQVNQDPADMPLTLWILVPDA